MSELRIAAVAAAAFRGEEEYRNAAGAAAYVEEAAGNGARLVCLPEGYPGPCNGPMDSGGRLSASPLETVQEAARAHGVYVSCGRLEETGVVPDTYYLTQKLISPEGEILASYRRCQPTPPAANGHLYGGRHHLLPGDELMAVETEIANFGLIICSEIRVPELARVEMLMGAEVLLAPFGGVLGRGPVTRRDIFGGRVIDSDLDRSRAVALARAIENTMYVVIATNIWEKEARWGACIASPDGILAEQEGAGIVYANLDMDRLRALRGRAWQESDFAGADSTVADPGRLRDRRPELYGKLVEPQRDAFNYRYYADGPDDWRESFARTSDEAKTALD